MRIKNVLLGLVWSAVIAAPASADTLVIKLATVAPSGSIWHEYVQDLDERWRRASEGNVQLKIYAGTLGDEADIIRRIRVGQIDAATVTTGGLGRMHEAATALNIPLAFASYAELDHVQARMAPTMEKALQREGVIVLNWGDAGWVHFFTKTPVRYPRDLNNEKVFVWTAGDSTAVEQVWKRLGFQPVPLSVLDIIPALQTGMITAYQAPPIAALANQWFAFSKSMTDLRWAPLTGATIVSERVWSRIPPELKPKLLQIARDAGERLRDDVRRLEKEAIAAMVKRGMQVTPVPSDAYHEWEKLARSIYPDIRGKLVPASYFDEVLALRDEYRAAQASARTQKP